MSKSPRIAILGAGPTGLEAALYAAAAGFPVTVYERGLVGAHIREWGHVRLFTPWALNLSSLGRRHLAAEGTWRAGSDDPACPTGAELVERYLEPVSRLPELRNRIRTGCRVVSVGRAAMLKGDGVIDGKDRAASPFRLLLEEDGRERTDEADVVLDATGVFGQPNRVGRGGIPAPGERSLGDALVQGIPDPAGRDRARFEGRRVLVVGDGYSAATTILALAGVPGVSAIWTTRGEGAPLAEIENDVLPGRATLAHRANALAAENSGWLRHRGGASVEGFERTADGVTVHLTRGSGSESTTVDLVVAQTGFHPDRSLHGELQIHRCYASEGPMKLAAALFGDAGGDCMTQGSHGPDTLTNPEPGFFILGNKSYGRNSQFLMRVGREQIRDAFTLITADATFDLYAEPELHVS